MWGAGQLHLTGLAHHAVLWLLEFAVCMTLVQVFFCCSHWFLGGSSSLQPLGLGLVELVVGAGSWAGAWAWPCCFLLT